MSTLPVQLRLTKYDPALRSPDGSFAPKVWTAFSDVGEVFDGVPLTLAEYERVEANYVESTLAFLREANIDALQVDGLENPKACADAPGGRESLAIDALGPIFGAVLRERYWCRFECPQAFVHIGWDFYLYIGLPHPCPKAVASAQSRGLFVEPFSSPHIAVDEFA